MSKYKCIIFDCDGVLVDSEPLSNQVMVDMTNELGGSINLDYAYKHFKGNSLQKCIELIANLIQKEVPKHFETEYRRRSFEKFKNEIKPVDGIIELIKNLSVPFCVASSGPENKIRLNLDLWGQRRRLSCSTNRIGNSTIHSRCVAVCGGRGRS